MRMRNPELCTFAPALMAEEIKKRKIFDFSLLKRVFRYAAPLQTTFVCIGSAVHIAGRAFASAAFSDTGHHQQLYPQGRGSGETVKHAMESMVIWITILQIALLLIETVSRFLSLLLPPGWDRPS